MESNTPTEKTTHQSRMNLVNRSALSFNGVTKVISATPSTVSVKLGADFCQVEGENLSVTKLDMESGVVDLTGTVNTIKFNKAKASGKNFLKRIFS